MKIIKEKQECFQRKNTSTNIIHTKNKTFANLVETRNGIKRQNLKKKNTEKQGEISENFVLFT